MRRPVILLALALPLGAPPLWSGPTVQCLGPKSGHFGADAICQSLMPLVEGRQGALTLTLSEDAPHVIAGQLSWDTAQGPQSGPEIEVTTRDKPVDTRAALRLLRSLLAASPLP